MHLTQGVEALGAHLENLMLQDLLAWRSDRLERAEDLYWRTAIGEEVDFVIEVADRLLSIEVKATERLRDRAGLGLLHTGTTLEWLAPDGLSAPWWRVL